MEPAEIARAFDHPDAEQRRRAVSAMAQGRDPAFGALLLRALGDPDFRVREEAIRSGRDLAERLALTPALIDAVSQGENVGLRNAALALLKGLGAVALAPLLAALPRLAPGPRRLLLETLGHGGDQRAMRMLTDAVQSPDLNTVTAAIEALALVGGPQAEQVLRKKAKAQSPFERIAALDALARLDAVLPWDEIEPLLADRVLLRVAVRLLGRSNRREAIPPLFDCLNERSEAVAGAAAAGLLKLAQGELRADVQSRYELADEAVRARLSALVAKDGSAADPAAKLLELLTTRPAKAAVVPADPRFAPPRTPRLELHEFRAIADHIRRVSGIRLTEDMRASIERRLAERLGALGFNGYAEYQRYLAETGDQAEIERAVELIATNETYFFRDLPQLGAFERDVLPELHRLALPRRQLSVWSAGCSTGEEPYTLAIMLARSRRFFGWNLRVFGNDICRKVVQVARRGVYRGASFRAMPPEYEHYFEKTAEGSAIDPAIRAMCQFARFNLLDSTAAAMFGRVDVIFCRNVLIYFDDDARRRVIEMFYERLQPGGYLLLGHSDSLLQFTTAFELAHLSGDLAFRKPLTADSQG